LGVIMPFSRCSGVRAAPVPGALGGLAHTRTALSSKRDGWPYGVKGEPGIVIQGGTLSVSARAEEPRVPAASALARKILRSRSPSPARRVSRPTGGWRIRVMPAPLLHFAARQPTASDK